MSSSGIKLMGVNVDKNAGAFDAKKARSRPSSFFTVSNLDEVSAAEQIIVNRLCEEPDIKPDEVKLITPVTMPNPLAPVVEKCDTPLEIQVVYGPKFSILEVEVFIQEVVHYFDGVIHSPLTIEAVLARMADYDYDFEIVLPVTTSHQYVVVNLGLDDDQQKTIENFEFTQKKDDSKFYFKVYSDYLDVDQLAEEMCDFQPPIREIDLPETFTPQKLGPISTDEFVPEDEPAEVEFCEEPMDLHIFVDTTYNMWRQMDYGKDLKELLNRIGRLYFGDETEAKLPVNLITFGGKDDNVKTDSVKLENFEALINFTTNFSPKRPQKRKREQPFVTVGKYLQANPKICGCKAKILILTTGQDAYDQRVSKIVVNEIRRRAMPLVVVEFKTETSDFAELKYGEQIEISRSRKFLSGSEGLQFVSDKLCQPGKPIKYVKKVPKRTCEAPMATDVVLVIDGSYSTQQRGFNIIVSFLKKVVKSIKGDVNYGAIQYSDVVTTEFSIRDRSTDQLLNLLSDIEYDAGWSTKTGAALTEAYESVHSGVFGARDNTTKVILLVTDGKTKDDIEPITNIIRENDDTIVIAVGLQGAPIDELNQIATDESLVFYTKGFQRIWNFFGTLTDEICHLEAKPSVVPDVTLPVTTTISELTTKLTTKLETVKSTTKPTVAETTTPVISSTTAVLVPAECNMLFLLPKEIKPVDAQNLIVSTPANNVTVIVGMTPIIENKPKDEVVEDIDTTIDQKVIDEAEDFTNTVDLANVITDLVDSEDETIVVPVVAEKTKNTPTILKDILSMKLAPVTTINLIDEVETIDLTDLHTPAESQVDLNEKPAAILFFPKNTTTQDIEQTLKETYNTTDLADLPEDTNTTIVIGSTLLHPENPVMTPLEQVQTLPNDEALATFKPLNLSDIPDIIDDIVAIEPNLTVVPIIDEESQVLPELIDEILPLESIKPVISPVAPEFVVKPVDLLTLDSFDHVGDEDVVIEKIDELLNTTAVPATTTTVATTTAAPIVEKPMIITMPENVTLEEIKNTLALVPETNHTVTLIVGQTPLIENENILDHPEDHISEQDVKNVEPVENPLSLIETIKNTLEPDVDVKDINLVSVVTDQTKDIPDVIQLVEPEANQTVLVVGPVKPVEPVPEPEPLWNTELEPTDNENIVVLLPNNVTSEDVTEFLKHGITDHKDEPSKVLAFIGPKPITNEPKPVAEIIPVVPTNEEIALIEPLTPEKLLEVVDLIDNITDPVIYPIVDNQTQVELPILHSMLPECEIKPHPIVMLPPPMLLAPVFIDSLDQAPNETAQEDFRAKLPDEFKVTTTTSTEKLTTTAFTTRKFTTTPETITEPTKPTTILLLPSDIEAEKVDQLIEDLPDQEAPVTVVVGNKVIADKQPAKDVHVEPEQIEDVIEEITEDNLPEQLTNITTEIVVPVITPTDVDKMVDVITKLPVSGKPINLAPIQVGELDKPVEDLLQPVIVVPEVPKKPVKKNNTILLLPTNTTIDEVPLIVDVLDKPDNVTVYIGPVKVVDQVFPDKVAEALPTQEEVTEELEKAPTKQTVPDLTDFHNENIVALVSCDETVDDLKKMPSDNKLTEIVMNNINTTELDDTFDKPIRIHTLDELAEEDVKNEIVDAQEDKPHKALIIVPEETSFDDLNEIIHDIEMNSDIDVIDMVVDNKLVIENGPIEFTVVPDSIRKHPSFEAKPTVDLQEIIANEPKDTAIVPIVHSNATVPDEIKQNVDDKPKFSLAPVYIDPPPKVIHIDTIDEVKDNKEIFDTVDEKVNEVIAKQMTTTTTKVTTTAKPIGQNYIQPVQPCYILPISTTKPEFEALVDSVDEENPITIVLGDTVVALEDLPKEVHYPKDFVNVTEPEEVKSKDVLDVLQVIPNIEDMTLVPILKPENKKLANYIANAKLPMPLTLEPVFVDKVKPEPIVPEDPIIVDEPTDVSQDDIDEAKKRVRRSVEMFPYNYSPSEVFNVTKKLPIDHPIDIFVGDEPVVKSVLIDDLVEEDIVISNPKPLTQELLDPILEEYDDLTTIIPIIDKPGKPFGFVLPATCGPLLPLELPPESPVNEVDQIVSDFVENKLIPVENNVTFVLPSNTTDDEKEKFDDHLEKVNPSYQSCVYDSEKKLDSCNDTFVVIPLIEDVNELVDIEEELKIPIAPICIGEPMFKLAPMPVLELPSLQTLTKDVMLPANLCADFDSMLHDHPDLEHRVFVFFPNQMVNFDSAVEIINHIFDLAENISVHVFHFNTEFVILNRKDIPEQMRAFYTNMIRSRTETLQSNSMELLQKLTTNSIVVNVQGSESSVSPFQNALAEKVHCIQQR